MGLCKLKARVSRQKKACRRVTQIVLSEEAGFVSGPPKEVKTILYSIKEKTYIPLSQICQLSKPDENDKIQLSFMLVLAVYYPVRLKDLAKNAGPADYFVSHTSCQLRIAIYDEYSTLATEYVVQASKRSPSLLQSPTTALS